MLNLGTCGPGRVDQMGRMVTAAEVTRDQKAKGELPRLGQGSLTERTTQALLEAILERRFPDDRLPNEPDLAEQMGVSRTTIRGALQALDRLGVISRAPGRGTRVRSHIGRESMLLHRVIGIRGMLEGRYGDVAIEQTFTICDQPSELARAALGLDVNTPMLLNDKTYLVEGVPAVHLLQEVPLDYVDPHEANGLVAGTVEPPPSIFDFSISWPNREIDHSVIELVPQVADAHGPAGGVLRIQPGAPYIELRETHYSDLNEPVAYNREYVDDAFTRLRLVRTR